MIRTALPCLLVASTILLAPLQPPVAPAAQDTASVSIGTETVADGLYMLTGAGGNMGLLVGDDGAILIDDQFAPLSDKILATLAELTDAPLRFVLNTHWHFDHTGGNENMGAAGAIIVAHENVRARMSVDQVMEAFDREVPAAPAGALPRITFADAVSFHWNGQTVNVFHVADAHTDGDAIIHFVEVNALHMGDTFFNGMYPFIDTGSDGHLAGMLSAANRALVLCDDDTKIIPGHGGLAGKAELEAYRDMLVAVQTAIAPLVARGLSRDEVVAAHPTAALDAQWGGGFMRPDVFTGIVYDGMLAHQQTR